jgi:lactoylglutathione lyase
MNSNFLGLRTAAYKVGDLVKAKKWYSEVLGLDPYFDEPFYVGFNVGGYELGLLPYDSKENNYGSGGVSVYWGVEDIEKMYSRLLGLGASPHEEPTNVGGELMVATVKDPWDNIFGLIYNPYFKLPE